MLFVLHWFLGLIKANLLWFLSTNFFNLKSLGFFWTVKGEILEGFYKYLYPKHLWGEFSNEYFWIYGQLGEILEANLLRFLSYNLFFYGVTLLKRFLPTNFFSHLWTVFFAAGIQNWLIHNLTFLALCFSAFLDHL